MGGSSHSAPWGYLVFVTGRSSRPDLCRGFFSPVTFASLSVLYATVLALYPRRRQIQHNTGKADVGRGAEGQVTGLIVAVARRKLLVANPLARTEPLPRPRPSTRAK
jgi:hypothetical protein